MKSQHFLTGIYSLLFVLIISCTNGPVKIYPDNPHYFSYKGKPIVLITSDHHYGAIIDLDFDYAKYLKFLADNGMNLTRIYPGGMFEPPDKYQKGNPLGPRPGRQLLPWARSEQAGANPALAEAGQPSLKFDLDSWNPDYFIRLKDFVALARKYDIIVEVPFFNGMYADCWPLMAMYHGNNIQNIGQFEAADCGLYTTTDERNKLVMNYQKAYIQKITSELNPYDNVIYDICDEPSLQGLSDGSIIVHPDSLIAPWIYEMKEAFLSAEKSLPKKHLLGQTVRNLSPDFSKEAWCEWLPCEYVKPGENALNIDYMANKPIVNVESNYFGSSLTKDAYTGDAVRIEGWMFMLGGGAGSINLNGDFYRGSESGQPITVKQIVPQRKLLKEFMEALDLSGLTKYKEISGIEEGTFCNGLAEDGKQYALYLFHGSYDNDWGANFIPKPGNYADKLTLNNIPEGTYFLHWYDPVTGSEFPAEKITAEGGNLRIITPPYTLDIALRISNSRY